MVNFNFDCNAFIACAAALEKAASEFETLSQTFDKDDARKQICIEAGNIIFDDLYNKLGDVVGRCFVETAKEAEADEIFKSVAKKVLDK